MKNTSVTPTAQKMTLADIIQKRVETKQKLTLQKEKITATSAEIFTPILHLTSGKSYLNHFTTGINLINGIFLGYKLMKKFRKFFHKNR